MAFPKPYPFVLFVSFAYLMFGCAAWSNRHNPEAYLHSTEARGIGGHLFLEPVQGGVRLQGMLTGLVPGPYSLYLHPTGACGQPDAPEAAPLPEGVRSIAYAPSALPREAKGKPLLPQGKPLMFFYADPRGKARIDFLSPLPESGADGRPLGSKQLQESKRLLASKGLLAGKSLGVHEAFSQLARGDGLVSEAGVGEQVACGVVEP